MATNLTPKFSIPWPDGTERVMDGDNAMGAIANKMDGLGIAYAQAAGAASISAPGSTPSPSVAVTFPIGRFTVAPIVFANLAIGTVNYQTNASAPTTSGFTATMYHNTAATNVGSGTYPVHWHAVQMLPASAAG